MEKKCRHPLLVGVVIDQFISKVTCCDCDKTDDYEVMYEINSKAHFFTGEDIKENYLDCFLARALFKKLVLDNKDKTKEEVAELVVEKCIKEKAKVLVKTT